MRETELICIESKQAPTAKFVPEANRRLRRALSLIGRCICIIGSYLLIGGCKLHGRECIIDICPYVSAN